MEDTASELRVSLALPGHQLQDVEVRTEGRRLIIEAMRRRAHAYGGSVEQIRRSLELPEGVDSAKADATLHNGMLTVVFPRSRVTEAHTIPVRAGRDESPRPRHVVDLGSVTLEERRPGVWQRMKEWLTGRKHTAA